MRRCLFWPHDPTTMPKELNFKQDLVGCFGFPVAENPTQAMIEPAFKAMGLGWRYLTLEVHPDDLPAAVAGARAFGFRGFNCTIPHKIHVIGLLNGLGKSAQLMGAVNCVVRRGDLLIGENTDGKGFVSSFREIGDPAGKRIVIFGAGGAARAIAVEMALAGSSHITIVNRNVSRGQDLTDLLNSRVKAETAGPFDASFVTWDRDFAIPADADAAINATSIGLYPDTDARLGIDFSTLRPDLVVADVIPNPPRTHLVRTAADAGCKVIDGLGMLVAQGVIGIEYWTGKSPDPAVMRAALEEIFGAT